MCLSFIVIICLNGEATFQKTSFFALLKYIDFGGKNVIIWILFRGKVACNTFMPHASM